MRGLAVGYKICGEHVVDGSAARAFLFEACDEAWSTVASGAELTLEQRAKVRLSCAQVADIAKSVVRIAYDIGGGTAVYETCPLQRCFRDAHANIRAVVRLTLGNHAPSSSDH